MASKKLPTKLGKEPLIDAVFELRFACSAPASDILPGALFSPLSIDGQNIAVERLPLAQVPESFRRSDPSLQFSPTLKIDWGDYSILIGDSSIAVSCKRPYRGWRSFRGAITRIVEEVAKVGIVKSIERYSLKYVDLVPAQNLQQQTDGLNWNVRVGTHQLKSEIATVRVEIPRGDFLHIVSVQTGAAIQLPNQPRIEGVVVDVDSICRSPENDLTKFIAGLSAHLDLIHHENKEVFFECLTQGTIDALEPSYD